MPTMQNDIPDNFDNLITLKEWLWQEAGKIRKRETPSAGIHAIDPKLVWVDRRAKIGNNVRFFPNVLLRGVSILGDTIIVESGTIIEHSVIQNNTAIKPYTIIRNSTIGVGSHIGPAALIEDSTLEENAGIGFTAQIKRSQIGKNITAKHHCYIGDATIGDNVNIGAGCITGNYDGLKKNKTIIHDDAFIGINVNLVAPILIGRGAIVAAGSTITENVAPHTLVIARAEMHRSVSTFQKKTLYGYERLKIDPVLLKELKDFFGEYLYEWLTTTNTACAGKLPIELLLENNEHAFRRLFETTQHSSCT